MAPNDKRMAQRRNLPITPTNSNGSAAAHSSSPIPTIVSLLSPNTDHTPAMSPSPPPSSLTPPAVSVVLSKSQTSPNQFDTITKSRTPITPSSSLHSSSSSNPTSLCRPFLVHPTPASHPVLSQEDSVSSSLSSGLSTTTGGTTSTTENDCGVSSGGGIPIPMRCRNEPAVVACANGELRRMRSVLDIRLGAFTAASFPFTDVQGDEAVLPTTYHPRMGCMGQGRNTRHHRAMSVDTAYHVIPLPCTLNKKAGRGGNRENVNGHPDSPASISPGRSEDNADAVTSGCLNVNNHSDMKCCRCADVSASGDSDWELCEDIGMRWRTVKENTRASASLPSSVLDTFLPTSPMFSVPVETSSTLRRSEPCNQRSRDQTQQQDDHCKNGDVSCCESREDSSLAIHHVHSDEDNRNLCNGSGDKAKKVDESDVDMFGIPILRNCTPSKADINLGDLSDFSIPESSACSVLLAESPSSLDLSALLC